MEVRQPKTKPLPNPNPNRMSNPNDVPFITYEALMLLPPEKRVREASGNILHDKIAGILIGYSFKLQLRNGHIDILTLKDAEVEIIDLIQSYL